jgi:hypothetical protein
MAFLDAQVTTYSFPVTGTVAATRTIKGPLGRAGRVLDVSASASVDFVGTTTPTTVLVKTLAAAATQINYATVTFGTAATPLTTLLGQVASAGSTAPSDTVAGIKRTHELPKDTGIRIQTVAGVGGTVAGSGEVNVTIGWY